LTSAVLYISGLRAPKQYRLFLEAQKAEHDRLKAEDVICPWVFNRTNKKVKGERITTFIKAFRAACTKAGCPGHRPWRTNWAVFLGFLHSRKTPGNSQSTRTSS
jgi:hypothetical protein